jgi:hypothetical protein
MLPDGVDRPRAPDRRPGIGDHHVPSLLHGSALTARPDCPPWAKETSGTSPNRESVTSALALALDAAARRRSM